jgi:aspartate aminotransferase-like enzyme
VPHPMRLHTHIHTCMHVHSPAESSCRLLFLSMEHGCSDPVDPEPLAKSLNLGEWVQCVCGVWVESSAGVPSPRRQQQQK